MMTPSSSSDFGLRCKLSTLMFLQYFVWACWYVSMGAYLTKSLGIGGAQVGLAYGAFAIAAMISPFLVGLVADRYFATEKIICTLGLLGSGVMFLMPQMKTFETFYPLLIIYCLLYVPTLALGNSLALHHLKNAKSDFPRVKLFSAVGWIAGLVTLNLLEGGESSIQFYLSGMVSLVFGTFAFFLPHTPPMKAGGNVSFGESLGLDALALMRKPAFAVFIVAMFFICIPLYAYFVNLGIYLTELKWENMLVKTSLAQISDVVFFLLLPFFLRRIGFKFTLILGAMCWMLRYLILSESVTASGLQNPLIFSAILLHGVCYDFLFVAGQLYVDEAATVRMRGAAQGFFAFITWGVGSLAGTWLAGLVLARHEFKVPVNGFMHDWQSIWQVPAWASFAVMIFLLVFFHAPHKRTRGDES